MPAIILGFPKIDAEMCSVFLFFCILAAAQRGSGSGKEATQSKSAVHFLFASVMHLVWKLHVSYASLR